MSAAPRSFRRRRLFGLLAIAPLAAALKPTAAAKAVGRTIDPARLARYRGPAAVWLEDDDLQIWDRMMVKVSARHEARQLIENRERWEKLFREAGKRLQDRSSPPVGAPRLDTFAFLREDDEEDVVWRDDTFAEILRIPRAQWNAGLPRTEPASAIGSTPPGAPIAVELVDPLGVGGMAAKQSATDIDDLIEGLGGEGALLAERGQQVEQHAVGEVSRDIGRNLIAHSSLHRSCGNADGEGQSTPGASAVST